MARIAELDGHGVVVAGLDLLPDLVRAGPGDVGGAQQQIVALGARHATTGTGLRTGVDVVVAWAIGFSHACPCAPHGRRGRSRPAAAPVS